MVAKSFKKLISNMPEEGLYMMLGIDNNRHYAYTDLKKAEHILMTGLNGTESTRVLHAILASLVYRENNSPCTLIVLSSSEKTYSDYRGHDGVFVVTKTSEILGWLKLCCSIHSYRKNAHATYGSLDGINELDHLITAPIVIMVDDVNKVISKHSIISTYLVQLLRDGSRFGIHLILGTASKNAEGITKRIDQKKISHITWKYAEGINSSYQISGSEYRAIEMVYSRCGMNTSLVLNPVFIDTAEMWNVAHSAMTGSQELRKQNDALCKNAEKYIWSDTLAVQQSQKERAWTYDDYKKYYTMIGVDYDKLLKDREREKKYAEQMEQYRKEAAERKEYRKKHKRVGLIRGMWNLLQIKPIMFSTSDYPPRI